MVILVELLGSVTLLNELLSDLKRCRVYNFELSLHINVVVSIMLIDLIIESRLFLVIKGLQLVVIKGLVCFVNILLNINFKLTMGIVDVHLGWFMQRLVCAVKE